MTAPSSPRYGAHSALTSSNGTMPPVMYGLITAGIWLAILIVLAPLALS